MSEHKLLVTGLAFVCAAGLSFLLTPVLIRVAFRLGMLDRPADHKFHRAPTPYLGGLVILGIVLAVLSALFLSGQARTQTLVVIGAGVFVGAVGLLDDWRTLRPLPRLVAQALAATALWRIGIRIAPSGWAVFDYLAMVFVVLAVTNAINLIDNMDGVAAGIAAIAAAFFLGVAVSNGQAIVAVMAALLSGACLGFLPFNLSRARIFLGDAGALFIGFLLATIAIKINLPSQPLFARVAIPWLILAVPFFDMTLVVISRLRGRRPVFRGSTDHAAHRLVALGASPLQAAAATYVVGALCGAAAISILRVNEPRFALAVVVVALAGAAAMGWFLERTPQPVGGPPYERPRRPAGHDARPEGPPAAV